MFTETIQGYYKVKKRNKNNLKGYQNTWGMFFNPSWVTIKLTRGLCELLSYVNFSKTLPSVSNTSFPECFTSRKPMSG